MNWKQFSTTGAKDGRLRRAGFRAAFSLLEVIVSVTLFTVIIMSATEIFKMVIDAQRSSLASQNVQESLKYFLEVTAKEIRMSQKNNGVCPDIPDDQIPSTPPNLLGDTLKFKNYYGQCVTYSLEIDSASPFSQRFKINRDSDKGYISPAQISIDSLHFLINASTSSQPSITMNLTAHALNQGKFNSQMTIQTTITPRYYK